MTNPEYIEELIREQEISKCGVCGARKFFVYAEERIAKVVRTGKNDIQVYSVDTRDATLMVECADCGHEIWSD